MPISSISSYLGNKKQKNCENNANIFIQLIKVQMQYFQKPYQYEKFKFNNYFLFLDILYG